MLSLEQKYEGVNVVNININNFFGVYNLNPVFIIPDRHVHKPECKFYNPKAIESEKVCSITYKRLLAHIVLRAFMTIKITNEELILQSHELNLN